MALGSCSSFSLGILPTLLQVLGETPILGVVSSNILSIFASELLRLLL